MSLFFIVFLVLLTGCSNFESINEEEEINTLVNLIDDKTFSLIPLYGMRGSLSSYIPLDGEIELKNSQKPWDMKLSFSDLDTKGLCLLPHSSSTISHMVNQGAFGFLSIVYLGCTNVDGILRGWSSPSSERNLIAKIPKIKNLEKFISSKQTRLNLFNKIEYETRILVMIRGAPFVIQLVDYGWMTIPDYKYSSSKHASNPLYYRQPVLIFDMIKDVMPKHASKLSSTLSHPYLTHLFYQILISLNLLHSIGISHADYKWQNVIIESFQDYFFPNLLDFGISDIYFQYPTAYPPFHYFNSNLKSTFIPITLAPSPTDYFHSMRGTCGFISPEFIASPPLLTTPPNPHQLFISQPIHDSYSIGISFLLTHLALPSPPFTNIETFQILYLVVENKPLIPYIQSELNAWLSYSNSLTPPSPSLPPHQQYLQTYYRFIIHQIIDDRMNDENENYENRNEFGNSIIQTVYDWSSIILTPTLILHPPTTLTNTHTYTPTITNTHINIYTPTQPNLTQQDTSSPSLENILIENGWVDKKNDWDWWKTSMNLVEGMIDFDPIKRTSVREALDHPLFSKINHSRLMEDLKHYDVYLPFVKYLTDSDIIKNN